jgi:hypothetical protein
MLFFMLQEHVKDPRVSHQRVSGAEVRLGKKIEDAFAYSTEIGADFLTFGQVYPFGLRGVGGCEETVISG